MWGVNDFDEAAEMPWPLDLVRLATSAVLAGGPDPEAICAALLRGYSDGLANPGPVVLEKASRWLRREVMVSEDERADFWDDLDHESEAIPVRYETILRAALPAGSTALRSFARTAGAGSLGRPRFVAVADWRGGPVIREAKGAGAVGLDAGPRARRNADARVLEIATRPVPCARSALHRERCGRGSPAIARQPQDRSQT